MADPPRRSSSASRLTPEEITNRGFASAFRGVSETEVRNFLRRVADDLAMMRAREAELNREIEQLQEQLANPPPVTEQQLLDALGEETARVLRSAQTAPAVWCCGPRTPPHRRAPIGAAAGRPASSVTPTPPTRRHSAS